jgi:hypothetical protein
MEVESDQVGYSVAATALEATWLPTAETATATAATTEFFERRPSATTATTTLALVATTTTTALITTAPTSEASATAESGRTTEGPAGFLHGGLLIVSEVHADRTTADHGTSDGAHDRFHMIFWDLDVAALLIHVDGANAPRRDVCGVVNQTCDVSRARVVHAAEVDEQTDHA